MKKDIIKLWQFLKNIDDIKWSQQEDKGYEVVNRHWKYCRINENPNQNIESYYLSLWLTYIYDYRQRTELLWPDTEDENSGKGLAIMMYITHLYIDQKLEIENIKQKVYNRQLDRLCICSQLCIPARTNWKYPLQSLWRTLKILNNFNRNIVELMKYVYNIDETEPIRNVAYALYLITYDFKKDENEVMSILYDKELFKKEKLEWKKSKNYYHKRVWAGVRDFFKGSYSKEFLSKLNWNKLYLEQLELPGDVHNIYFIENIGLDSLLEDILDDIPDNYRAMLRKFYEENRDILRQMNLYVEQFDVSYDYDREMCKKARCKICPLYVGQKHKINLNNIIKKIYHKENLEKIIEITPIRLCNGWNG